MKGFRSMRDGSPVILLDHVKELVDDDPEVEVLVGTDSQNRADSTVYATTVVIRYKKNGAHVLYKRERAPKITDLWTRLWGEVERSIAVAQLLSVTAGIKIACIDMDLNSDPKYGSNKLHSAAVGYVHSHGYQARTKPDLLIASWAADVLCN